MAGTRKLALLVILVALSAGTGGGCAYMKDRGNDALDMFDIGFTFTSKPHVSVYAGFQSLLSFGYSDFDGKLAGLGTRQFGWLDMRYRAGGMILEGHEQYAYEDFDAKDPDSPRRRGIGLGMLYWDTPRSVTEWMQCPKLVHLGFIGVDVNCKVGEIFDFLIGWTTLDIGRDDRFLRAGTEGAAPARPASTAGG